MARSSRSTRASVSGESTAGSRNPQSEQKAEEEDAPPTVRRSGRNRKPPPMLLKEANDDRDELAASPTFAKSVAEERRRAPKRKAAPEVFDLPDDLLDRALAPMGPNELDEWEAWIELESDPAFFNVILQDLGVKEVKIQELFSLDEGSLAVLPKPVHGLIFLYQYIEEDAEEPTEDYSHKIWFANQTSNNACATLALFNIIMNAEDIELGDRLKAFKASSAPLVPPLRGDLLCNTAWIRTIHNQFARRLDLLNADLVLAQEAKDAKKKKPRQPASKRRRTKPSTDAAFHFIAYVPVGNQVYQLDGLEKAPVCIGQIADDDWTAVARPFIEARMLQYESEQLSFNLLALCGSPLRQLREALVANIAEHAQLTRALLRHNAEVPPLAAAVDVLTPDDDVRLQDLGISHPLPPVDPESRHVLETTQPRDETTLVEKLRARREEVVAEQARLRAEYASEVAVGEDVARRANGRKKDYTPFIHRWVEKLAEMGALADIAGEVAVQQG